jgi:hypothetical protein
MKRRLSYTGEVLRAGERLISLWFTPAGKRIENGSLTWLGLRSNL